MNNCVRSLDFESAIKLIDKIPKKKKKNNYLKEQYDEVLKFFPNAKALFEQSFEEISKRGYWNL